MISDRAVNSNNISTAA